VRAVAPDGWFLNGAFALELRLGVGVETAESPP
jgi:hypothetical protein